MNFEKISTEIPDIALPEAPAPGRFQGSSNQKKLPKAVAAAPAKSLSITSYVSDSSNALWNPPPPTDEAGNILEARGDGTHVRPFRVDFYCACAKLSNISTVNFTALVRFLVCFEWNDPRLASSGMTTNDLPGDLWGPDLIFENAMTDLEVSYGSFSLVNPATGRLKRTITFHGNVYNPMDLKGFPFDSDELEMKFVSISNWRTLDGNRFGNDPVRRVYTLHPMLYRKDVNFLVFGWMGKVNEFQVMGWSHKVEIPDEAYLPIQFQLDFHLVRKSPYYYGKVFLPLLLLVTVSMSAFFVDVTTLQGRLEIIVTVLLSTIAFLHILEGALPKISSLSVVDRLVVLSLLSLFLSVVFCIWVDQWQEWRFNHLLAAVNYGLYLFSFVLTVLPPYVRHKRKILRLASKQRDSSRPTSGSDNLLTRWGLTAEKEGEKSSFDLTWNAKLKGDHHRSSMVFWGTNPESLRV